jgi:hypothetical protein
VTLVKLDLAVSPLPFLYGFPRDIDADRLRAEIAPQSLQTMPDRRPELDNRTGPQRRGCNQSHGRVAFLVKRLELVDVAAIPRVALEARITFCGHRSDAAERRAVRTILSCVNSSRYWAGVPTTPVRPVS